MSLDDLLEKLSSGNYEQAILGKDCSCGNKEKVL